MDSNTWHLGEMVDLDIMVNRKILNINEDIQLDKLERPKLKNTMSFHVQNEMINTGKNKIKKYLVGKI